MFDFSVLVYGDLGVFVEEFVVFCELGFFVWVVLDMVCLESE